MQAVSYTATAAVAAAAVLLVVLACWGPRVTSSPCQKLKCRAHAEYHSYNHTGTTININTKITYVRCEYYQYN